MNYPLIPKTAPGQESTLRDVILNGDTSRGFDKSSLQIINYDSLTDACDKLHTFLTAFLVPDDELVARFAILKESAYEREPSLREGSGCFNDAELTKLQNMRSDYVFTAQTRQQRSQQLVQARMQAIASALISENPTYIKKVTTVPIDGFSITLGAGKDQYFEGESAVQKLSQAPVKLVCYQARPNNDLSTIGALALYGGTKSGALASFDQAGKLSSLVFMNPKDIGDVVGIDVNTWLNPAVANCRFPS
jgi:hypothetical protein